MCPLEQLKKSLELCPLAWLPEGLKQKAIDEIRAHYTKNKIYDAQWAARSTINDIFVSRLIGMNEVVIPHFISEYAKLTQQLKEVKRLLETMKKFNIPDALSIILNDFDVKTLYQLQQNDLQALSKYGIDYNDFLEKKSGKI
jgi:hypothetical protein